MRRFLKNRLPDPGSIAENPWLRPFRNSLLHPRLWHLNRHSAAGAVATGLACGLIPGPFQMLGAALCAVAFRVNLPLALFVTLYTNPLTIVPLYLLAYQLGRLALFDGNGFVIPPEPRLLHLLDWSRDLLHWMLGVGKPLGLGLLLLAALLAGSGYLLTRAAWRYHLIRQWRKRQRRP
ncbi:DUF2062 domain-containing protein [Dechloromonas sp. ZY10]|uniref:DUF2062 domain-containing protein n=1 Tax=Dechloromonas aquae TaxID=2664436 RepID=UPI0035291859